MNEKDIRTAFEQIEPADGAQERMYQNILKKAAAQHTAPKRAKDSVWQRYGAHRHGVFSAANDGGFPV